MDTEAKGILDDLGRARLDKKVYDRKSKEDAFFGENLGTHHITTTQKNDAPEVNMDTTESKEDEEEIIRGNTLTPEAQQECDEERRKNLSFEIEGYLRRSGKYKPLAEYVPVSRTKEQEIEIVEDEEDEEDQELKLKEEVKEDTGNIKDSDVMILRVDHP